MLQSIFTAIKRLTASINRSADLFDAANEQLAERLAVGDEVEALPAPETNGRRLSRVKA